MKSKVLTASLAYASLSLAGGFSIFPSNLLPVAAAAPLQAGDKVSVTGAVRDFRMDDTGFVEAGYGGTYGHVAGNVDQALDTAGRPAFCGNGFVVDHQWRNADWNPIAPHLYRNAAEMREVPLTNPPTINNTPTMDTFDSTAGPYGSGDIGPAPTFVSGSQMPVLTAPTGLPPKVGDVNYSGSGTTTLSTDVHCDKLVLQNSHTLQISGHRIVYAEELFKLENSARLIILPDSSLTLYTGKDVVFENAQQVNMNTGNPALFRVLHLGTQVIKMENTASIYGQIVAPYATLHLQNDCHLYGTYIGRNLTLENGAGFHIDTEGPTEICGVEYADQAGLAGGSSSGGIASDTAFADWYRDALGTNLSASHDIVLTRNGSGIYEYMDDAFFPIDNRLFGNEGMNHNYYFTFMFSVEFVHRACDGRFLQFEGADDTWAFVDGDLALDLGGILPGTDQVIEFDRLELTDGQTYRLHFFYAQRNPSEARFRLRTNLDLVKPDYSASASPSFD